MGGVDRAVPAADRAGDDTLDGQRVQRGGDPDDIDDRIERTDLVELHGIGVDAVHGAFGLGEHGEHVERHPAHRLGEVGFGQQLADHLRRPVRVMVVMHVVVRVHMVGVGVGVGVVHDDVGPRRGNAAALHPFERERVAIDAQTGQSGRDLVAVCAGVDERAEEHVAGHPGRALDVGDPRHDIIRATAQAAPKPLSMPTTVTPLAHDESIASSAVTPSSDVP